MGLALTASAAHAQVGEYYPPQCEMDQSHFLIKNSVVYLKGATEEKDVEKAAKMRADAHQNLLQAVQTDQADNPAAWYFLGRYYVLADDAAGADTAFDRVERLLPECEQDIVYYRTVLWAPRINAAIDSLNGGNLDAAKDLLHKANQIYDLDNLGYYYLAVIHGQNNVLDSARHYFMKAAMTGAIDSTRERNVEVSTYNAALLYAAEEQWDSARVWYEKYRELRPNDPQGIAGLATAHAELGNADRAASLYDSVFAMADSLSLNELFGAGQRLFNADQMELAVRAFELGLEKNPYHRDGLFNLTNSYLGLAQDTTADDMSRYQGALGMENAARRLIAIEPFGHEAYRLLAASFRYRSVDDSTLAVLQRLEDLPFAIEVYIAEYVPDGMRIRGTISNMRDRTSPVPTITFEFLDAQGNVLTTDSLSVTQLERHGSQEFDIMGSAEEIAAWRYTVGS